MAFYEINLAKGRVIPARARRVWFCALMLYIALMGVVSVVLANRLTRDLVATRERRERLQILEHKYLGAGPQQDIIRYADSLGASMAWHADTLEALNSIISQRSSVAHILLGLASPLPAEASLFSVELSADKREIIFEVLTPEERSSEEITPPNLIAAWERDPDISREVAQITSVNRQRIVLNGRGALIWRFTGHLTGKGS
jgi:hypothetical protein